MNEHVIGNNIRLGDLEHASINMLYWACVSQSGIYFLPVCRAIHPGCQYLSTLWVEAPLNQYLLVLWFISMPLHVMSVPTRGGAQHSLFCIEYSVFVRQVRYSFETHNRIFVSSLIITMPKYSILLLDMTNGAQFVTCTDCVVVNCVFRNTVVSCSYYTEG